jgi:flagellin FlaB
MERQMFSFIRQRAMQGMRSERGITGLETAIILIAFVVVASVFAYTVLTAGVFSSQKSSETVNAAIDEVRSNITLNGNTIAYKGAVDIDGNATTTSDRVDAVAKIAVTAAVTLSGLPIDVTPAYQLNTTTGALESSGATNSLVVNFVDQQQVINNVAWTVAFSGANDGDFSLEPTERAVITVWLVDYSYDASNGLYYNLGTDKTDPFLDASSELLGKFNPFSLQLSPVQGTPLVIEKVVPQSLNDIMNLR